MTADYRLAKVIEKAHKVTDTQFRNWGIVEIAEKHIGFRFRKDIYFCTYKTTIEDKNAVILIFTIKLPNTTTGSSASSEIVMNIVELLENSFAPIDEYNFLRNIDGVNKNIAILRVTKIIEPDYIIGEEIEN